MAEVVTYEVGPQRRLSGNGLILHCCCICQKLDAWGYHWSAYYSEKDLEDGDPIPKFCSEPCRERGGVSAKNVTQEMKRAARDLEFREPKPYMPTKEIGSYISALRDQRAQNKRAVSVRKSVRDEDAQN